MLKSATRKLLSVHGVHVQLAGNVGDQLPLYDVVLDPLFRLEVEVAVALRRRHAVTSFPGGGEAELRQG